MQGSQAKRVFSNPTSRGTSPKSSGVMVRVAGSGPATNRRKLALLVDDDGPSLRAFERILSRREVDILSASSVSQAIGLAGMTEPHAQPAVAFVDVLMPAMDGPRFVHTLRSMPAFAAAPIVLVSGLSQQVLEKTAAAWGADGFVPKSRGLLYVDEQFAPQDRKSTRLNSSH